MPLPPRYALVIAPIAETQIDAALLWWEQVRASSLLARELESTLAQLAFVPRSGRRVRLRGHASARRLLLQRTAYHIYYVVDDASREVRIVYFRHARRRPLRSV